MILHEDRDCLVLNKPFGLAVQGGSGTPHHIDGMLASLPNERGDRPALVHRLDRDTSGVLLVARTRKMAADLGEIFRSRQARKTYWALVEGVPKPAQGRISLFLAKGAGMGDARHLDKAAEGCRRRRSCPPRKDARGQARRRRRPALRHLLRDDRQGADTPRVALDEADHRADAPVARPRRGDRTPDHRRSQIWAETEDRSAPQRSAAAGSGRHRTQAAPARATSGAAASARRHARRHRAVTPRICRRASTCSGSTSAVTTRSRTRRNSGQRCAPSSQFSAAKLAPPVSAG